MDSNKDNSAAFRTKFQRLSSFLKYDIWRITDGEVTGRKYFFLDIVRSLILAVRGFGSDGLKTRASALTYNTLIAIIPLLAVLFGIAKGFGFQSTVADQLIHFFPAQAVGITKSFQFVENYLSHTKGGLFIGVGLIILFYTVITLISAVESTFNSIWQIKKERLWYRKTIDYLAMFLLLPILMTASSGLSILVTTIHTEYLSGFFLISPLFKFFVRLVPYIITILVFTFLYVWLPNTRVKFSNAFIAACVSGVAFQLLQYLYIHGQMFVSSYNAIYGSFAILPLLMLWLQISWLICLFGAEFSYAIQNVEKYSFDRDSRNISRRYNDFFILIISSFVVKRFAQGLVPYTASQISEECQIPIRITSKILYQLVDCRILTEAREGADDRVVYFQPAMDISRLSVAYLTQTIDEFGSEEFKIDVDSRFSKEWKTLLSMRSNTTFFSQNILLKDL